MIESRKYVNNLLSNVQTLKHKYEYEKKVIVELTSETEYQQTMEHFDNLITKLTEKVRTLPIGYRYRGKFFLKIPYNYPVKFSEHEGAIFMREDLYFLANRIWCSS